LEEALKRKDNIIRVRNAQISALWDELHTRQPWKNAIKGEDIVAFPEDAANTTRKLAVLGINTVSTPAMLLSHVGTHLCTLIPCGLCLSCQQHFSAAQPAAADVLVAHDTLHEVKLCLIFVWGVSSSIILLPPTTASGMSSKQPTVM